MHNYALYIVSPESVRTNKTPSVFLLDLLGQSASTFLPHGNGVGPTALPHSCTIIPLQPRCYLRMCSVHHKSCSSLNLIRFNVQWPPYSHHVFPSWRVDPEVRAAQDCHVRILLVTSSSTATTMHLASLCYSLPSSSLSPKTESFTVVTQVYACFRHGNGN